jgi:formylmethanofuran dehydrogenase subunit A
MANIFVQNTDYFFFMGTVVLKYYACTVYRVERINDGTPFIGCSKWCNKKLTLRTVTRVFVVYEIIHLTRRWLTNLL